jgi:uncharacterized repeat protein (TIGR03803 family)
MRTVRFSTSFSFALFSVCLLATSALAASPQETVLHNFGSSTDGWWPLAPLTMDAIGNIYGTTSSAGASGGTVFELTPNGDGTWTETILHQFGFGTDGTKPLAGVVVAADGKIYGTTSAGGTNNDGVIFKLTPESGGVWDEKILLNFDGENGAVPSTLVSNSGYLYGATSSGGKFDYGIVFRMTHEPSGEWTEKILHTFNDNGKDGYNPTGGIVFDSAGDLYSTTALGGAHGYGTVFELLPQTPGAWPEKIIHSFNDNGTDGYSPEPGLAFDSSGDIFGATNAGGSFNLGAVFRLTPNSTGRWSEKILHSFGNGMDGSVPFAGVIADSAGNLYGTTDGGGTGGRGAVFEMIHHTSGYWSESVLHSFGSGNDGYFPRAGVIVDKWGNIYGTTLVGGTDEQGTVFEVMP